MRWGDDLDRSGMMECGDGNGSVTMDKEGQVSREVGHLQASVPFLVETLRFDLGTIFAAPRTLLTY